MELLNQMVILFLIFRGNVILISRSVLILVMGIRWYLIVVLICISLMMQVRMEQLDLDMEQQTGSK